MFTEPDTWNGGFFELALELGPRNDQRLRDAVSVLWKHPTLAGCYLDRDKEPGQQKRLEPASQALECNLYGVAMTPAGKEVACRSLPIRFDDGIDWLYLVVPLGSLGTADPVGAYPFDDGETSMDWIIPVSEWFRGFGDLRFSSVAFRLVLNQTSFDEWSLGSLIQF